MKFVPPRTLTKEEWPPDYVSVFAWRQRQLSLLRSDPMILAGALEYYKDHCVEFVNHFCDTYDPRNALKELPAYLPFIQFERQAQLLRFVHECNLEEANGLIDKSRDMGVTWDCCAYSVWLWRFHEGASVGWGSRKEQLVDKIGDPDSIFQKLRLIVNRMPRMFWPVGFDPSLHMTYMKVINPENGATITGEAGDNIGRGGRKSIYFKDESAHYEHPESIEAALGDNTRCQIDISTTAGIGTVFDRKRDVGQEWVPDAERIAKGVTRVFVADWRDHPEKDEAWHAAREKQAMDEGLLHVFKQEVDRDPRAALQGIIIPGDWVRSAIDAHLKMAWPDEGGWSAALDVADEGGDLNALTIRKGIVLTYADCWGEGDTGLTTSRTVGKVKEHAPIRVQYDSVGVGAGVKAEFNRLNRHPDMRDQMRGIIFVGWNAGEGCVDPEKHVIPGDAKSPLNKDFYSNLKAQGWWELRRRFERTHRALKEGIRFDPADMISLSSTLPRLRQIERELSQPTMEYDGKLRLKVEKKPEGARSPNIADSIMMNYFPMKGPLVITKEILERAKRG